MPHIINNIGEYMPFLGIAYSSVIFELIKKRGEGLKVRLGWTLEEGGYGRYKNYSL